MKKNSANTDLDKLDPMKDTRTYAAGSEGEDIIDPEDDDLDEEEEEEDDLAEIDEIIPDEIEPTDKELEDEPLGEELIEPEDEFEDDDEEEEDEDY